jgi:hypothetical protein
MPKQEFIHQRCHNHRMREAAARCPECSRFFCRECITEHADKVLCATCLGKAVGSAETRPHRLEWFFRLSHLGLGVLILYMLFYYLAWILLMLPSSFHEGTLWQSGWWAR